MHGWGRISGSEILRAASSAERSGEAAAGWGKQPKKKVNKSRIAYISVARSSWLRRVKGTKNRQELVHCGVERGDVRLLAWVRGGVYGVHDGDGPPLAGASCSCWGPSVIRAPRRNRAPLWVLDLRQG